MRGASGTLVDAMQIDLSEAGRRFIKSPERRLLQTILHDAIQDAVNHRRSSRRESTVTAEARNWIFGIPDRGAPRRWNLGDFETVCGVLELDHEAVRRLVRDTISGLVPLRRRSRLTTTVRTRGAAA